MPSIASCKILSGVFIVGFQSLYLLGNHRSLKTNFRIMRKQFITAVLFIFSCSLAIAQYEIELTEFTTGLNVPTCIAHDGTERLFITEKSGRIRIVEADGSLVAEAFLNITDRVRSNGGEQGLLGLAFHPDHANNGHFFVNYTRADGSTVVSRFTRDSQTPDVTDPSTEKVLFTIPQPFSNHNGGDLHFGPDGYLYISSGDGGSGGDPQDNGQDGTSLLGKILRIDVDNGDPYDIPADNPFVGHPGFNDLIWSYGLRNPWRFSFDRENGDMWIGDVGQGNWEEIDREPSGSSGGLNYGWRCYEGFANFNLAGCSGDPSEYTFPVHVYANSRFADGCSVTGGYVYRGTTYPIMYGDYIYTDFCSGKFWALRPDSDTSYVNNEIGDFASNQFGALGEDVNGELYTVALQSGILYRISLPCWLSYDVTVTDQLCPGEPDGSITLDLIDQTGEVHYEWSTGDTTMSIENLDPGLYYVTVTDGSCSIIDSFRIELTQIEIDTPVIEQRDSIVVGPGGFSEYIWTINGEEISTGADSTISIEGRDGEYSLVVIDENGCISPSSEVIFVMSGNGQKYFLGNMQVYPNPAEHQLWVELPEVISKADLSVFDSHGKIVFTSSIERKGNTVELDLSGLPPGSYFMTLRNQDGFFTARFVKSQ